jgi:flagellar hook assembly protein FlgD
VRRASHARVAVYDVAGRHVKTLFDGPAAGRHSVEWDGRDQKGEAVSAGVYFCRITADGFTDTKPMTLLR